MNWYKTAARSIERHVKDVIKADLNSPVFVTENFEVIDGGHRTAKAYIMHKKVPYIVLTQEDLNPTMLSEDSDYVGQIYRDDDKNEYSVTKLIELYGKRKPKYIDAKTILKNSEDVWGKISIHDIIEKVIERVKSHK